MNTGAPTCSTCGGLNTAPQVTQCRFCGQPLPLPQPPQGYAMGPGYGAPPGYGTPPGYGAPPGGYGMPPAHPYGGPHANPYGQNVPVAGFGGVQPFHGAGYVNRSGWASGWSTFVWVRLAIAAVAIAVSLLGACVSALSH